jgi:hypothetical protein
LVILSVIGFWLLVAASHCPADNPAGCGDAENQNYKLNYFAHRFLLARRTKGGAGKFVEMAWGLCFVADQPVRYN